VSGVCDCVYKSVSARVCVCVYVCVRALKTLPLSTPNLVQYIIVHDGTSACIDPELNELERSKVKGSRGYHMRCRGVGVQVDMTALGF